MMAVYRRALGCPQTPSPREGQLGTGPFFGEESCFARKASAEDVDLSPFAA